MEMYSTAVEIGKKLTDAKQCDYLYNGCPIEFEKMIKMIAQMRGALKASDKHTFKSKLEDTNSQYREKHKPISTTTTHRPVQQISTTQTNPVFPPPNAKLAMTEMEPQPQHEISKEDLKVFDILMPTGNVSSA